MPLPCYLTGASPYRVASLDIGASQQACCVFVLLCFAWQFSAGQLHLQALLRNIASWMKPEGLLFIHIFTHKSLAYHFEVQSVLRLG